MWYEKCAHCGRIHTPYKFTAVYINKRYFCKPSCSNSYHEKEKGDETTARSVPRSLARFEHG